MKLLEMIGKNFILVNFDEAVFSPSTKTNYSWSITGVPSNLSTQIICGSISIVSSITSNGLSVTDVRKGTITSSSFIEYIDNLFIV